MPFPSYHALNNQMIQHFQAKEFAEALDLITREGPNFPESRMLAEYWKLCAAARVDNRALVYQVTRQLHSEGLWYGETLWRQTPSFKPLQGDPEFEQLVKESLALEAQDTANAVPVLLTHLPANHSATSPLLMALHGNFNTAELTRPYWQAAVAQGYVLALPQSTQAMQKGSYIWDDLDKAHADMHKHFAALQQQTAFDAKHIILAGHSMGGFVTLEMAVKNLLPVKGFVVNGPAVPFLEDPAELDALLPAARERGLRGYFIVGTEDDAINHEEIRALAEKFNAAGIICEIEMVPDATHDYHTGYDAALVRGLQFVNA